MKFKSTFAVLLLAAFTALAADPQPTDPCDGPPPSPHSVKLSIEKAGPGFVNIHVKAPASVWFELLATEDFVTWHTILIAFGQGHDRVFTFPTTPLYSPFTGEIGGEHLFFTLRLHKACEPIPPL